MKIKIRKSWGDMKPITKRIDSSKIYKRKGKFTKWNLEDWKNLKTNGWHSIKSW